MPKSKIRIILYQAMNLSNQVVLRKKKPSQSETVFVKIYKKI